MTARGRLAASVRRMWGRWRRAFSGRAQAAPAPIDASVRLAAAVLARADGASLKAEARSDLARVMRDFGVEPAEVPPRFWERLRSAERTCMQCASIGRCQHWAHRRPTRDSPRRFCPNAALFDEIAASRAIGGRREDRPRN